MLVLLLALTFSPLPFPKKPSPVVAPGVYEVQWGEYVWVETFHGDGRVVSHNRSASHVTYGRWAVEGRKVTVDYSYAYPADEFAGDPPPGGYPFRWTYDAATGQGVNQGEPLNIELRPARRDK